MPTDPTSAHWYDVAALTRLVYAHIGNAETGGRDLPVGEFVRQFAGLTSTTKAKRVTAAVGDVRHLSDLAGRPGADLGAAGRDAGQLPRSNDDATLSTVAFHVTCPRYLRPASTALGRRLCRAHRARTKIASASATMFTFASRTPGAVHTHTPEERADRPTSGQPQPVSDLPTTGDLAESGL